MYFLERTNNGLTYSVDMLRLRADISPSVFADITNYYETYYNDFIYDFWIGGNISSFHYNYNIRVVDGVSFWFGFQHNSEEKNKLFFNFTLEFNPNKIKDNKLLLYLFKKIKNFKIISVDLAVDIPIIINDICGLDKARFKDLRTFDCGFSNKTIYIGRTNKRIKIYNKKIESNLDIKGELTRIEEHLEFNKINPIIDNFSISKFPDFYTNDYFYTFKDYEDKTLLAVLYAVQCGFPLSDLTKTYKNKIKNLLKGSYRIEIEEKEFYNCIKDIFSFYNF